MRLFRVSFRRMMSATALCFVIAFVQSGCKKAPPQNSNVSATSPVKSPADDIAAIGRDIFFDRSLSGSGKLACASCHDPEHAYAPGNRRSVQLGGSTMRRTSFRAVPSLRYVLNRTPNWHQERASAFVERIEESDNPPFGGFGWDGRFKTIGQQAQFPLLSPDEMGNTSTKDALAELQQASYIDAFRKAFGAEALKDPATALSAMSQALERFELTDSSFHPYSSKFDAALDGKVKLSAQELRGEKLFNDPARGNCASCHTSSSGADGSHPLFTNFQFEVLGVPRNREIPANRDPKFYDLGLCGPVRTDHSDNVTYCGMFKTPSLRNVATRGAFFHNGYFHTLRAALEFYVRRDTNPEEFYPADRNGRVDKFNDLPIRYRSNADTVDLPLTKHRGERPVWSEADIDDVIAFLNTLTDGYMLPEEGAQKFARNRTAKVSR